MTQTHEKIVLSLFLVINSLFFIEALKLPIWGTQPEPGFMPFAVVVALYLMIALAFVRGLRSREPGNGLSPQLRQPITPLIRGCSRPASFLLATLLYVSALQALGYYISSFLFCMVLSALFVLGRKNLANSLMTAVASSAISLAMNYLLYERVFGTPLG
ncbi:MAG: tripartite tricarboxylate transporter TctB family protein [Thermosphaera sp.]